MNQNLRVNKTNFNMKGFALGLALKQRRKATRKSPIGLVIPKMFGHNFFIFFFLFFVSFLSFFFWGGGVGVGVGGGGGICERIKSLIRLNRRRTKFHIRERGWQNLRPRLISS